MRIRVAHVELHREPGDLLLPSTPRPRRPRQWRAPCSRVPPGDAQSRGRSRPAPVTTATPGIRPPSVPRLAASQYASAHGDRRGKRTAALLRGSMGRASRSSAWPASAATRSLDSPDPGLLRGAPNVIFDNRDSGQSSMAEPGYTIADMARDALARRRAGARHLHLLGCPWAAPSPRRWHFRRPGARTLTLLVTFATGGAYSRKVAEVWGARVMQISREQHVDELMLLNHSEEFYENPDMVAFIRSAMLQNPHPQPPEAFVRQLEACSRHNTLDRLGKPHDADLCDRRSTTSSCRSGSARSHQPSPARSWTCSPAPPWPVRRARRGVQRGRARLHPRDGGARRVGPAAG